MSLLPSVGTLLVPGLIPPEQCDHQSTPTIVMEVEQGYYRAQCLTCGTVGPVQHSPQAAQQELMDEGARRLRFSSDLMPSVL
jgi:hypothetical protein